MLHLNVCKFCYSEKLLADDKAEIRRMGDIEKAFTKMLLEWTPKNKMGEYGAPVYCPLKPFEGWKETDNPPENCPYVLEHVLECDKKKVKKNGK